MRTNPSALFARPWQESQRGQAAHGRDSGHFSITSQTHQANAFLRGEAVLSLMICCIRPPGLCMVEKTSRVPRILFFSRSRDAARGKLRRLPDGGVEEFDFIAAEFLDALATDAAIGLCEDFDARAIGEFETALGGALFEEDGEVSVGEVAEVAVHFFGLLEAAAEDADLDAGFEEEIEERRDGPDGGFSSAAAGPDDSVAGGVFLEETVSEIIEWCLVALANVACRHVQIEKRANPLSQLLAILGTTANALRDPGFGILDS